MLYNQNTKQIQETEVLTEQELIELADNMVGGATQMGPQGYELLVNSRDRLKIELGKIFKNLDLNMLK